MASSGPKVASATKRPQPCWPGVVTSGWQCLPKSANPIPTAVVATPAPPTNQAATGMPSERGRARGSAAVSSAAPARGMQSGDRRHGDAAPATVARWERLIKDIAEEHGVFASLANLVGSEGGKIFPGASIVFGPKGDPRARGPLWEEALITADLDRGAIMRPEHAAAMQRQLPQLQVAHIPGAGHNIRREQFDRFLEVVRAFLAGWATTYTPADA